MSKPIAIEPDPTFEPGRSEVAPERPISGPPRAKSWPQDASRDGTVPTGVGQATPGEPHAIKGPMLEACHIPLGWIEIEAKGGDARAFGFGDTFVMKPGFTGVRARSGPVARSASASATERAE